jgi:hypothetical protein
VFRSTPGSGAARIRPSGAPQSTVSSSWASGVTDINLDGIADLVVVNGGFPDGGVRNKIPGTDVAVTEPPAIFVGIGEGRFVDAWPSLDLDLSITARGLGRHDRRAHEAGRTLRTGGDLDDRNSRHPQH